MSGPLNEVSQEQREIARLIEEQVWVQNADADVQSHLHLNAASDSGDKKYLEDEVFPTLVPALHELLAGLESKMEQEPDRAAEMTKKFPVSEAEKQTPEFGNTGRTHPVDWIAQYLLRHNTRHSDALRSHPYLAVQKAAKEKRPSK